MARASGMLVGRSGVSVRIPSASHPAYVARARAPAASVVSVTMETCPSENSGLSAVSCQASTAPSGSCSPLTSTHAPVGVTA